MTLSASDRLDILELVARFSYAFDCRDADAYANCFKENGCIRFYAGDSSLGEFRGATALRGVVESSRARPVLGV